MQITNAVENYPDLTFHLSTFKRFGICLYVLIYILCSYHRSLHVNLTIRHSKLRYIFANLLWTENETKSLKTIHN